MDKEGIQTTRRLLLLSLFMTLVVMERSIFPIMAQHTSNNAFVIKMTDREAESIGWKIWLNEAGGKSENLIVWNKGETFVSLGIGHFIWYPPGKEGPFHETFPHLLKFLEEQGVVLPAWLTNDADCPWKTKEEFLNNLYSREMKDLRGLLTRTISQQARFIIQRLETALAKLLAHVSDEEERTHIQEQFYRVAKTPTGLYALVDYVNFKGEGIMETERYQGEGWGLLQVLQQMPGNTENATLEFADAAEFVLTRRVKNASPERQAIEAQWLPGWKVRIDTYRQFSE